MLYFTGTDTHQLNSLYTLKKIYHIENVEVVPKKGNKKIKGLGCDLKEAPLEEQLGWFSLGKGSGEEVGGMKPQSSYI